MVTLEVKADEENAFGPAAELVAEWRELRTGGTEQGSSVDQAGAEERRWDLEVVLIEKYRLTLPPERAIAGVEAGRPPAVAEGGPGTRPQATRHGRAVGDVAYGADAWAVAEVGIA